MLTLDLFIDHPRCPRYLQNARLQLCNSLLAWKPPRG